MTNKGNREPSRLKKFLWWCAGVDEQTILQCPTEWAKYASMGGTILFTGLFAGIAGGYACYTIFRNGALGSASLDWVALVPSFVFGIFWGTMIFNIDRYIITSFHKSNSIKLSERFRHNSGQAIPRLVMAIIIAFTISKPLEVKIMENEIQETIASELDSQKDLKREQIKNRYGIYKIESDIAQNDSVVNSLAERINNKEEHPLSQYKHVEIDKLKGEISNYEEIIKENEKQKEDYKKNYTWKSDSVFTKTGSYKSLKVVFDDKSIQSRYDECNNKIGNAKIKRKKCNDDITKLSGEIDNLNEQHTQSLQNQKDGGIKKGQDLESVKDTTNSIINEEINTRETILIESHSNRFATQLMALHRLKYPKMGEIEDIALQNNDILNHNVDSLQNNTEEASLIASPTEQEIYNYRERLKEQEEIKSKAMGTRLISWFLTILFLVIELTPLLTKLIIKRGAYDDLLDLAEEKIKNVIEAEARISTEIVDEKVKIEVKTNADLMKKITSTQAALIETAIEEWRQQELQKIKENPSVYIETTTSKS